MNKVETAEHFLPLQCKLGEGVRWNVEEGRLYWVDIEKGLFFRYDPASGNAGQLERFDVGQPVSVLAFREKGGLVMGTRSGLGMWDFASGAFTLIAEPEAGKKDARFNDGAVDAAGRFWAGTMTPTGATSSLYRLDPDGSIQIMESGLGISNGVGWSPDGRTMYLTDSPRYVIYAYDFDVDKGTISNRRAFVQESSADGQPDGMTVDSQGFVWSAHWGACHVVRYDPAGKVERVVELPVSQVTCCAFGGPELTDLYITTAWTGLSAAQRAKEPLAGDMFVLHTDIKGRVESEFRG